MPRLNIFDNHGHQPFCANMFQLRDGMNVATEAATRVSPRAFRIRLGCVASSS
jgi:hypothetical protein